MQTRLKASENISRVHSRQAEEGSGGVGILLNPLEAYLADTRRTLNGLTETEQDAVIAEVRQHLVASAQVREELGETPAEALQSAIAAFGAPRTVSANFVATYEATGSKRRGLPLAAMRRAARIIVPVNLLTSTVFALDMWCEIKNYYQFLLANETLGKWAMVFLLCLVLPIWAGWKIGATASVRRTGLATFLVLCLIAVATAPIPLLISRLVDSNVISLFFGYPCLFSVYWIFVMPLAAHIAERARRRSEPRLERAR